MRDLLAAAATAAVATFLPGVAAAAQDVPVIPEDPVDLGAYGEPIRFVGGPDTTFTFGDGRTYAGTVEARLASDGDLVVVNDVTMRTYVEGLAEVPFSWPEEALKAQAVAARTYAWLSIELASFSGYDICDTVACQVYHGRDLVDGPGGDRWRAAVAATDGEVLVHDGGPILARYFSTSGGHTRDNEEVFPGEGPRPYLKGVADPEDVVSPLHRWQVRFTREHFDEILSHGRTLSAVVPLATIEHVDPRSGPDQVVAVGRDGTRVQVTASEFRSFVSSVAPELYPSLYPAFYPDSDRRHPATLPSSWLSFEVTDDEVVVDGRGWGHGVGMSQYGAKGKAEAGMVYADILAAYYNGLRPTTVEDLPDRVRVGVDRRTAPLTLRADSPFRVEVGGTPVTERGLGAWEVSARPDGSLGLTAPPGYGAPLVVSPTQATRESPYTIERISVDAVVNKPSELRLEVTDGAGRVVTDRDVGVVDPGRQQVAWSLDDTAGAPLAPGTYRARLVATDEDAETAGTAVVVTVREPRSDARAASVLAPQPPAPDPPGPDLRLALMATALGLLAGVWAGRLVPVRRPDVRGAA